MMPERNALEQQNTAIEGVLRIYLLY